MTSQRETRRIWLRTGPLAIAVIVSMSALAFVSIAILDGVSERLIRQQAEREAIAWAAYIGTSIERIEAIASGDQPTLAERDFLERVSKFGDIFRYKLFDAKGHLRVVSDSFTMGSADPEDLGEHNATAARVISTLKPYASVNDGTNKSNRPDIYVEAYVPIMKNGKVVAISEVYIDETSTSAQIKEDFAIFGVIIAGLTLVILLVPLWALRLVTVELRKRNFDLNLERARAVQAENAKSAFLANMSHELRTPLNAIQGLSEMMIRGDLGALEHPKYLEYSKDINFSAGHLLKLVNDILDLSKIDAGKYELEERELDLCTAVGDALRIARAWSNADKLVIGSDITMDKFVIRADERAIKQILLNLLSNAVKFTPAGGEVTVTGKMDDDGNGEFSVSDTGFGIPEKDLKDILEPFNQLRRPASLQSEGTGLGLSLVKSMVELHGGTVVIASQVGKGTTVTFTIPKERIVSGTATK
ncbi:MAG: HAMP domain-containing histidine kinase [Rhodospirillales bacterium]|nr:HAMP domain-containing histidine kinase [Rhodospirillales bacterium]MBO6788209.1 HAMP domain-containing histidine kinase [Rhodospirillales bacterium]